MTAPIDLTITMTNTPVPSTFGRRLRDARLHAGMSQSELERASGIPKTRLSRYENGHIMPSLESLRKLSGALGVPPAMLLDGSPDTLDTFMSTLLSYGVRFATHDEARSFAADAAAMWRRGSSPEGR